MVGVHIAQPNEIFQLIAYFSDNRCLLQVALVESDLMMNFIWHSLACLRSEIRYSCRFCIVCLKSVPMPQFSIFCYILLLFLFCVHLSLLKCITNVTSNFLCDCNFQLNILNCSRNHSKVHELRGIHDKLKIQQVKMCERLKHSEILFYTFSNSIYR